MLREGEAKTVSMPFSFVLHYQAQSQANRSRTESQSFGMQDKIFLHCHWMLILPLRSIPIEIDYFFQLMSAIWRLVLATRTGVRSFFHDLNPHQFSFTFTVTRLCDLYDIPPIWDDQSLILEKAGLFKTCVKSPTGITRTLPYGRRSKNTSLGQTVQHRACENAQMRCSFWH